jgi:hypothetical protein
MFPPALALAVSPWLLDYAWHPAATANAAMVGLTIALAAHIDASCEVSIEWLNVVAGLWLLAAPFVLGFQAEALATACSVAVGAAVAALAISALELDRGLFKRIAASSLLIRR